MLILLAAVCAVPRATAQEDSNDTRVEKYQDLTGESDVEDEADASEEELEQDASVEESEVEAEEPTTRVDEYLQEVPDDK